MSQKQGGGMFHAEFTFTEEILGDFEAMYLQKKEISTPMRVVLGALGVVGALYFGYMIYRDGAQIAWIGYLLICSVLLVLAFANGRKRPDDTTAKYRRYYHGKKATFTIDDEGVQMHLEGQKNYARSKFREIYGLFDTDRCLYFVIKGKAYYILPRESVSGGSDEDLMKYMQKKCGKRFLHYDIQKQPAGN